MAAEDFLGDGLVIVDGQLEFDLDPDGFIEWGPDGYFYTGLVRQNIQGNPECIEDVDESCCDDQALFFDANCEPWLPPTGCVKPSKGEFTGSASNEINETISPGSNYSQQTPQLCIPAPQGCYKTQALAMVCGVVTIEFLPPEQPDEDSEEPEVIPSYSVAGNVLCEAEGGASGAISDGFLWAWTEPCDPEIEHIHTFNISGCCDTGCLEPGEAWKPTFTMEIANGSGANTDISIVGWRVGYCATFLSMPPCGDFAKTVEESRT